MSSEGSAKGDGPLGVGSFGGYSSSASEPRTGAGGGTFKRRWISSYCAAWNGVTLDRLKST
jgi:hypothetical protein